jgi:hypothetical protein
MITSEPVLAYLHEVVFPRYYPNRPKGLEATLTADTICLDPAKAYDVINQSMCWTIESYRAAGEIRQELARRGQLVGLNNESKSRFDE